MKIFSSILAFFFSVSSFFTVLFGNNLGTIIMKYDESKGFVWNCTIDDESVAVIKKEAKSGSMQTFTLEGKSEGRTFATLTNNRGEKEECIFNSVPEINPYNGETEFYYIEVAYNIGTFISYEEGITLTAENPVNGGYWDFGFGGTNIELKSDPKTINGVCTFDVINPYMEDTKFGQLFTYYNADGTPLENKFLAFTLKKDGTIEYTDENRLAKIELPSDFSKLIYWTVSEESKSDAAEIIGIYTTSDTYGSLYFPESFEAVDLANMLLDQMLGKIPVGGNDTIVIEALKAGTAEFTVEKIDAYPIIENENGFTIDVDKRDVLETKTVTVTVDENLNISYEIK